MVNDDQNYNNSNDLFFNIEIGENDQNPLGLSYKRYKVIRLLLLTLFYFVLCCLIYYSHSKSVQYLAECEYIYSIESNLELTKSEYNALLSKKVDTLN